jgi:hypothetical protein
VQTPDPLVELPGVVAEPVEPDAFVKWGERLASTAHAAIAALLLCASAPLWAALSLEARRVMKPLLVHETLIGRSRRQEQRRRKSFDPTIDRRSIERRTQDLLGRPIECARFATDLGPISRWTARRRLDAVPMLLNVLRGEMALVGPRVDREETVLRYRGSIPGYERRFSVLPGVTGLAQVVGIPGDTLEGVRARVHYDLHYVEHRSWLLDLRILLRTAGVVLRRPGPLKPSRTEPAADAVVEAPSAVKGVTS